MKLGHLVIGVLLFGILIIGYGDLIGELNTNYNLTADTDFEDTFNEITAMSNLTQSINEDIVGSTIDDADPTKSLSIGAWKAAKKILQVPKVIYSFFYELFQTLPIPPEISLAILGVIVAVVVFMLISTVFGFRVI